MGDISSEVMPIEEDAHFLLPEMDTAEVREEYVQQDKHARGDMIVHGGYATSRSMWRRRKTPPT